MTIHLISRQSTHDGDAAISTEMILYNWTTAKSMANYLPPVEGFDVETVVIDTTSIRRVKRFFNGKEVTP